MRLCAISLLLVAAVPFAAQAQSSVPAKLVPSKTKAAPAMQVNLLKAGTVAPDFTAMTPDGKKVTLSDLRGKTVVLDFWATWCGPCMASMPGTEAIYQQVKNKNVVVLSVNSWDEQPEFVKWVGEKSNTYHFNFVRDPAEGDHDAIRKASIAKRLYNVPGIPTMYVIDPKGKIVGSLIGSGNEAELVKILGKAGVKASVPK